MSGLSNASAANGFMKGYSFMEGVQDRNDRKERQQKTDARAEEEYAYQKERRGLEDARSDTRWNQQQSEYNRKLQDRYFSDLADLAEFVEAGGDPSTDPRMQRLVQMPQVFNGVMDGSIPLESRQAAQMVDHIAPDLKEQSEVSDDLEGVGGLTRGKKPGTVVIGMRRKDGKIVPKTERQSTAEDDPVRQYEVDGLMQRGMGWSEGINVALNDPKQRRAFLKSMGRIKPDQNKNAGEYERLVAMRSQYKPGSQEYKDIDARIRKLTHVKGDAPIIKTVKDEMGGERLVRVDPETNDVIPLDAPPTLEELQAMEDQYADGRIDELGGFVNTAGDFKDYGGSEEVAREEFRREFRRNNPALYRHRGYGLEATPEGGAPEEPEIDTQDMDIRSVQGFPTPAPAALQALKENPEKAGEFSATFGYVPKGYERYVGEQDGTASLPDVPRPPAKS